MLEIEQKFADADFPTLERTLGEWGAEDVGAVTEEDHYFAAPDRDFRASGEAFRMRRVGEANYLTYKGPRQPGVVKIRTELELPLPPGEESAKLYLQLFGCLGYRVKAVVRKRRRQYELHRSGFDLVVCLDEVADLGRYAEVEVLAEEQEADAARTVLLETAAALGLTRVEQRSYLGLWLVQHGKEAPE